MWFPSVEDINILNDSCFWYFQSIINCLESVIGLNIQPDLHVALKTFIYQRVVKKIRYRNLNVIRTYQISIWKQKSCRQYASFQPVAPLSIEA